MPSEGVIGPKGEQGATGPAGKDGKEIKREVGVLSPKKLEKMIGV